ncbi:NusB antitermination factor [Desulfovibrio sp. X2]|uniref:transcription antitermination factor NusB n=1 Tax=Desulfovibrio sp. X2 TaxID=941449 RepID=UPI000358CE64|nr:transcription antitermination factor NusB [Desulfovibrio sp. X2]EPR44771.1 NusB antitermination factor [Desulfovibrio sp. X2]
MSKKGGARRLARLKAFQTLYGLTFPTGHSLEGLEKLFAVSPAFVDPEQLPGEAEELAEKDRAFAWELVRGVYSSMADLDEAIGSFSQHWKISRIARIELTILRLALYEMLHMPDIPLKVSINEAVELAKEFGDGNSPNFVNGILDAAARAVQQGQFGPVKAI